MSSTKQILSNILLLFGIGIFFFLAFIGFTYQNIDLSKVNKYTGKVDSLGTAIRKLRKMPDADIFFVKLQGIEPLGVYRKSQKYEDLLNEIKKNDILTLYYNDDNSGQINIDLIQIEREGKILLDKKEYEKKQSSLIYIGFIVGFILIGYAVLKYFFNRYISRRQLIVNTARNIAD